MPLVVAGRADWGISWQRWMCTGAVCRPAHRKAQKGECLTCFHSYPEWASTVRWLAIAWSFPWTAWSTGVRILRIGIPAARRRRMTGRIGRQTAEDALIHERPGAARRVHTVCWEAVPRSPGVLPSCTVTDVCHPVRTSCWPGACRGDERRHNADATLSGKTRANVRKFHVAQIAYVLAVGH